VSHPVRRPRRTTLAIVALSIGVAACASAATGIVQVSEGPTPGHPVFQLPDAGAGFYGLSVSRCGAATVWQIGTPGGNASRPRSIVYGKAPDGYAVRTGPDSLIAGCYDVFAGTGSGRFTIGADGKVAAVP